MNITLIGIGALGSVIAKRLSSRWDITVIDRDFVEENNLISQPIYDVHDIGKTKVDALLSKLPVKGKMLDVSKDTIGEIGTPDLLICATDTFESKFLINDYCKKYKISAIYASAAGNRAMILSVKDAPCFSCIFKMSNDDCETSGIDYGTTVKVADVVAEEIANITSKTYVPSLIYVAGSESEKIKVGSNSRCAVCKGDYFHLDKSPRMSFRLCGGAYILHEKFDFEKLHFPQMKKFNNVIHYNGVTFFSDGRIFVRAKTEEDAKRKVISLIQTQSHF
ncbi:MAG: ThiF family adenylyltransferase [archaeon]